MGALDQTVSDSIIKSNRKYQLSPYIRLVDGVRSWCVINLKKGDFILVNHYAARMLIAFEKATSCDEVFRTRNIPEMHQEKVEDFLKESIANEIIICADSLKETERVKLKVDPHISANKLVIVLELTTRCNLYCRHCYNYSGRKNITELSYSNIESLFTGLGYDTRELSTLTITGGEPFLYSRLADVIRIARNYGFPAVRVNTNGTIFANDIISEIDGKLKNIILVQITLLGSNGNTHDKMSRVPNSFSKTVENIARFQDSGFRVGVSFIRSKYSDHEIADIVELGTRMGIEINIGDLLPIGRAASDFASLEIETTKREINVVCDGKCYGGARPGMLSEDKRLSLMESYPPELPCGKNTVAIKSNGDVLPCMLLQGIVIGNILNESLHRIMNSSLLVEFRVKSAIENRNLCSRCELRYICSNKCPAVSLSYGGDIGKKNPFCEYYYETCLHS